MKSKIIDRLKQGDTKRAELVKLLNIPDRQLRLLVADMPEVGSSHKRGYFLIQTEQDLSDSIKDLRSKARSIFIRAEKQHANFGVKFQPELLFN